jgi:hypothetical protein
MQIPGRVQNGVVILEGGPPLPDGMAVVVSCEVPSPVKKPTGASVNFPLVHSKHPGSVRLIADRVAELLEEDDVSA